MKNSTKIAVAGCVTAAAIGYSLPALGAAGPSTQKMWRDAHSVLELNSVPKDLSWTGRIQYTQRDHQHGVCVETFNPTQHDIKIHASVDHNGGSGKVAPGFFIKFCQDGNFFVNDGVPFSNMESF